MPRRSPVAVELARLTLLTSAVVFAVAAPTAAQPAPIGPPLPTWAPNGRVEALLLDGDTLYVGGAFDQMGPATGSFAMVDAANDTAFTTGARLRNTPQGRMEADGTGGWYVVGGDFGRSILDFTPTIDHVLASGLVNPAWRRPVLDAGVFHAARQGDRLFISGRFTTVNGTPRPGLAALDPITGALLPWTVDVRTLGSAAERYVGPIVAVSGRLYVAGGFDRIGGVARSRFAVLDATTGAVLPAVLPSAATSPTTFAIIAAGSRLLVYGECRTSTLELCAYDLDLTPAPGWTFPAVDLPIVATSSAIFATRPLQVFPPSTRLVKLDVTTGAELSWAGPVTSGPYLGNALALAVEGRRLYLVGYFTSVNGQPRLRVASVDAETGALDPWAPVVGGPVVTIGISNGVVAVAGTFTSAAGIAKRNLVAIDLRRGRPAAVQVPDMAFEVSALVRIRRRRHRRGQRTLHHAAAGARRRRVLHAHGRVAAVVARHQRLRARDGLGWATALSRWQLLGSVRHASAQRRGHRAGDGRVDAVEPVAEPAGGHTRGVERRGVRGRQVHPGTRLRAQRRRGLGS
jgi:hypothetical protein